ncbi:transcription factor E3 isoform X1 [Tachysurus ichikawai]
MEQFKPPSSLGASTKEEKVKIAILLHTIGEEALEVYNTLNITLVDEENKTVEDVLTAFRGYCSPQKNVVFERHQFWSHPMADGITVDRFITELRQKGKDCEFGASENDMLRDKLVFSITNPSLKERLLRENDLSLHRAIEICRATELAKTQIQAMQNATAVQDSQINAIDKAAEHRKQAA